jgi:hypothetical protein
MVSAMHFSDLSVICALSTLLDLYKFAQQDIIRAMLEREPIDLGVWGDQPPNVNELPGTITLDTFPDPKNLRKVAREHIKTHHDLLEWAREMGKDLITISTSHGKEIIAGAGVAALAGIIGGIVLYRHTHRKG